MLHTESGLEDVCILCLFMIIKDWAWNAEIKSGKLDLVLL